MIDVSLKRKKGEFLQSTFFFFTLVTSIFGLISFFMLISAANGNYSGWALKQGITFIIFIIVMLLIRFINMNVIYRLSYYIYIATVLGLLVAELLGYTTMGAQRWLRIGPINFQPSEFAKIGVIIALAKYFHNRTYEQIKHINFLIIPLFLVIIPSAFIFKQPNLGTTLIVIVIALSIFFTSGVNVWFFIVPGISIICTTPIAWRFLHDYQKKRIATFLHPEEDLLGTGYNIAQSKIAIGSGGLSGRGFMCGTQNQLNFLPEKHTDFILTLLAEEWGFIGFCTVIILYILLITACYRVAFNTIHHFGKMIAIGVATMLFLHVFINVGMISGMLPVVGTPIPLLSYGGSNLAAVMIALGLVLSVDKSHGQGNKRMPH